MSPDCSISDQYNWITVTITVITDHCEYPEQQSIFIFMNLICFIASITVTAAILTLWLKHRIKHILSRGPNWSSRKVGGLLLLCCLSSIVYSLSLRVSDQVRADTCTCTGEWLTFLRHAPWLDWLCWSSRGAFLQIKFQPLGGATHRWPVSDSTVRS